jgi:antirestriction protein
MVTESFGNPAQHLAKGGGVRRVGNREYSLGRNWTNDHRHINKSEEHEVNYTRKGKFLGVFNDGGALTNERKHVNHDEDYEVRYAKPRPTRKGYKGARKFMAGGMNNETPRIYVADLEAYNNGRLVGEWLDLADYNDADELMDAIQNVVKKSGGEEYAIHDAEYIPSSMYSEYMGQRDFEEIYEMMELAKDNNLPLEVVQEVVSQYGTGAVEEFQGKYDSEEDFAEQLVNDLGIQSFNSFEYYLYISYTDRRLLSQEMADSYVSDIENEDDGNRIIEEAGLDLDEYENADADRRQEMIEEAKELVYDEYYNNWFEGLSDPYEFLVKEQGLYDDYSFMNASFVMVDYEKLANDLEQDYTFIKHDGDLYVFNII